MTLRALKKEVADLVEKVLSEKNIGEVHYSLTEPPSTEFGELTCNIAFLLAQRLHGKPYEVAKELVESLTEYLNQQKDSGSLLQKIEAYPSGHINFKAEWNVVSKIVIEDILKNSDYGKFNFGNKKRIIVEHTSVNPNKALHVGHMRNMIIGDVLYRILSATNHDTSVLYYVDDSGLQVADILVGFLYAGFSVDPPDHSMKFDQYCGDHVYVKINEMYASNPDLQEKRRSVMVNIEGGTSDLSRFAKEISIRVLRDQLKTCWDLKVRYDLLNFESDMVASKLWEKMFGFLKHKGIAIYENEGKNKGCWIIKGMGKEDDKVLIRSDGTLTYIAKDIPYAAWKLGLFSDPFLYYAFSEQWDGSILWAGTLDKSIGSPPQRPFSGAEIIINLIDSRQARLQEIISSTLSAIYGDDMKRYIHLSYEPVTLSPGTARSLGINSEDSSAQMSGRKGIYIRADQIMEIVCQKAKEEIQTRNPDMGDDELEKISRSLGRSAVRYNLIKQDLDRMIVFDLEESLSLDGDSGPYLQYAYARAQRLLEKGETTTHRAFNPRYLVHEREINLIRGLSKMDMVIEECAAQMNPKVVAKYAHNLAVVFNIFYEQVPVLRGENDAIVAARLSLVKAFSSVMNALLNYLGIDPLNRM
jgi:arginyl-tRNA synthetase